MSACSFNRLLQFVNKQLDLDGQLEVYDHLDRCDICRDAVCQLSSDRHGAFFIYRAHPVEPSVLPHPITRQEDLWVRADDYKRTCKRSGAL
jgi:predicted anti-sigma-YlaC factor YlaD